MNFDIVTLIDGVGNKLRNCPGFFANNPGRRKRYLPAAFGVSHLYAIEIRISPPAFSVVLNTPGRDLPIHCFEHPPLCLSYLSSNLRPTTDNVERSPGQKRCNGIEIRAVHL